MNGKTKSILLQVSAYISAEGQVAGTPLNPDIVATNYKILMELHETFNIDADDAPRSGGGQRAPRPSAPVREISGTLFFAEDGSKWFDFRQAKADGKEKPKFPDFKSEDMQTSVWLYDQEGAPTEEAAALVKAAELTAAF